MEKKILTLTIVVIIGIIIGVSGVAMQNSGTPVLVKELSEISRSLKSIDARLADLNTNSKVSSESLKNLGTVFQRPAPQPDQQVQQQPPSEDYTTVYDLDIKSSPIRGKKNAAVTIVEFVDFQCPFCQRFHAATNDVLKAYPNDVNYVVKNYPLPFHPMAKPAAKAALAAGEQGKYYEMAEVLLENGSSLSEDKIKELAKSVKLNVDKFLKDLKQNDAKYEEIIQRDMALAEKSDVRGTPTFYLNGKKTISRDLASFKVEIDKILQAK